MHAFFSIPNKSLDTASKIFLILSIVFMPLGTAPTNLFMALTIVAWLVAGGYKKRLTILKDNHFSWAALVLYGLLCIGAIYSTGEEQDIQFQLIKYVKLLFLLVAISLLQEDNWRKWAMNAFLLSMLITLILSLASVVTPLSIVKGTAGGPSDNHFVFKDHIVQNLMMSFFALTMLVKSQAQTNKKFQAFYLVLAGLAIVDIICFVQGRTGYISLALNIFIFIFFYATSRQRLMWLATTVLAGLLLFHFSGNFSGRIELAVTEFQHQDSKELSSIGQRVEFTKKSIQLIKERPVFGWGTGSYAKEFCRVAISEEWCQAGKFHPHNQFMAFGVQLGLLGIAAYLFLLGAAIQRARQFSLDEKVLGFGLISTLLTDSVLHAPMFLVSEAQFFILMLAVLMSNAATNKLHVQ